MTCFTSLSDVNRYSRIDVSDPRTRSRVDVADHGSEADPKVRIEVRIEPSYGGASAAVSRVSKLPTWTRARAATILAGSPGTGSIVV